MPLDLPDISNRTVQHVQSSLGAADASEEPKNRTKLNLRTLNAGESLFVPFELIHEPSLRVKLARENMRPDGRRFKLLKWGPPAAAYEIACVHVGSNAPVPRETQAEPEAEPPMTFDPSRLPPLDELGREIES